MLLRVWPTFTRFSLVQCTIKRNVRNENIVRDYQKKGELVPKLKPVNRPIQQKLYTHSLYETLMRCIIPPYDAAMKAYESLFSGKVSACDFHFLPQRCLACGSFLHTSEEPSDGQVTQEIVNALRIGAINLENVKCTKCVKSISPSDEGCFKYKNVRSESQINNELSFIRDRNGLVILMMDVTDIIGSTWYELLEVIGDKKNIILVVNKIDMLYGQKDFTSTIRRLKNIVQTEIKNDQALKVAKIKNILFTSLRYGYNITNLLNEIRKQYVESMDIFILGRANVGKSTLFNMIQDIICLKSSRAVPVQSMVSSGHGTSGGLIRHPISRGSIKDIISALQTCFGMQVENYEMEHDSSMIIDTNIIESVVSPDSELLNETKRTLERKIKQNMVSFGKYRLSNTIRRLEPILPKQCWLYDTPSSHSSYQKYIEYMTKDEISTFVLEDDPIIPRFFNISPGKTMVIGDDFMRIEVVESSVRFGKDIIKTLPLHMNSALIIGVFMKCHSSINVVPTNSLKILSHREIINSENVKIMREIDRTEFHVKGLNLNCFCADLRLPSIGWLSFSAKSHIQAKIIVHYMKPMKPVVRYQPLLPYSVCYRGKMKKIDGVNVYKPRFRLNSILQRTNFSFESRCIRVLFKKIEEKLLHHRSYLNNLDRETLKLCRTRTMETLPPPKDYYPLQSNIENEIEQEEEYQAEMERITGSNTITDHKYDLSQSEKQKILSKISNLYK